MPALLPQIDARYTGPRPPVSVVILTLNEEINLGACLDSCAWCDDVHVLDSGSTDATASIAKARATGLWVNPFRSFGQQRNWAIDNIPLRHDWVFHLDADERFTPQLVAEIDALLRTNPAHAGFYVANQTVLLGRWIKRSSAYPAYQMRLFHKRRMRFADSGHGQREDTTGTLGTLRTPYVHHNFSKGLADWFARHNTYSTKEAAQILADEATPLQLTDLLKGGLPRRRALKRLLARLPARPHLRFWHTLLIQRGLLDGAPGLQYARLLAIYQGMIDAKLREARAQRAHGPNPPAP